MQLLLQLLQPVHDCIALVHSSCIQDCLCAGFEANQHQHTHRDQYSASAWLTLATQSLSRGLTTSSWSRSCVAVSSDTSPTPADACAEEASSCRSGASCSSRL